MHPFQRFTDRAARALTYAQEEAERYGHEVTTTEDLLYGLLREERGVARQVCAVHGIALETVRSAVQARLAEEGMATDTSSGARLMLNRVIATAFEEAHREHEPCAGTEHLLLGLLDEGDSPASRILMGLGMSLEAARTEIIGLRSQQGI